MKKILAILIAYIMFVDTVFAATRIYNISQEEVSNNYKYVFDVVYPKFCESVGKLENFSDNVCGSGKACFGTDNENLIIGCSPVAYMSFYCQEELDKRNYDIVGFGSTVDWQILQFLHCLPKKYNKIVIWCAVNDLIKAANNREQLSEEYYNTLNTLLSECKNHLNSSPMAKIVFVNVKNIIKDVDYFPEENIDFYNNLAYEVNHYVKKLGIKSVDITTSTEDPYSDWYLHYKDPRAIREIATTIDSVE